MKTCYMCKGTIELSLVDVEVRGIIVKEIPAEICTRCGEKYFDTKTASFIQEITGCINEKRRRLFTDIIRTSMSKKSPSDA